MRRVIWVMGFCFVLMVNAIVGCSTAKEEAPPSAGEVAAGKLLAEGKYRNALEAFSKIAYDDKAGSHRALVGMALCYAHLGDRARFEAFALEAGAQAPTIISAHYRMGIMYVQASERFREELGGFRYAQLGVEYLRRVFAVRPAYHPDLVPTLGLGLHLSGDDQGATLMLEEAHLRNPERVDTLHTLLLCYRNLKNKERTRALLEPYSKRKDMPEAWRTLWEWSKKS